MSDKMPAVKFKSSFHLTFTIAIALHAIAILGFGYTQAENTHMASTIEVTLAKIAASDPDQQTDFYAQIDQQASGDSSQKKILTSTELNTLANDNPVVADIHDDLPQTDTQGDTPNRKLLEDNSKQFNVIVSNNSNHDRFLQKQQKNDNNISKSPAKNSITQQIVALNAQISLRSQNMAKALKKRTITTMSTKSHQDAAYLENWRKRIVSIGNIHYPKAANEQKIYGRVRLLIAMQADGQVNSIEILESSGKRILDQAAVKIVRKAAPFAKFSAQMRKNTDILEIIRTIEFEKSTLIY